MLSDESTSPQSNECSNQVFRSARTDRNGLLVKWYYTQFWGNLLAAFLLGCVLGWLWWRLQWRKVSTRSFLTTGSSNLVDGQAGSGAVRALSPVAARSDVGTPEFDTLNSRYQALVADREGQSKAFSALQFEQGGLKTALVERDAEIARLKADLEASKVPRSIGTVAATPVQALTSTPENTAELNRLRAQVTSLQTELSERAKELTLVEKTSSERGQKAGAHEKELTDLRAERDRVISGLRADHEKALADHRRRSEAAEAELSKVRSAATTLQSDFAKLSAEHSTQSDRLRLISEERDAAQSKIDAAQSKIEEATARIQGFSSSSGTMEKQLSETTAAHSKLEAEVARLTGELTLRTKDVADIQGELGSRRKELDAIRTERNSLRGERDSLKGERDGARAEIHQLAGRGDGLSNELDSVRGALDGVRGELGVVASERDGLRAELNGVYNDRDNAHLEIERLRAEAENNRNEMTNLRRQLDGVNGEFEGLRSLVDTSAAEHASELSTLRGDHGRELGGRDETIGELRQQLEGSKLELSETRSKIDASAAEIDALESRLGDAYGELDVTKSQVEERVAELTAQRERAIADREAELRAAHAQELGQLESRRAEADTEVGALRSEIARLQSDLARATTTPTVTAQGATAAMGLVGTPSRGQADDTTESSAVDEGVRGERSRDNLQRVEGIGPRIDQALQQSGINTFRDLSRASEQRLRAALEAAGLSFAPSLTSWAEQATLLARGDEEGFKALAARLVSGRREGK